VNCEEARPELEAYALGALDAVTSRRVAAHIADCVDCARQAHAYQTAVDFLSLDVPLYRASPRVKERVMGGIGAFRPPVYAAVFKHRWVAGIAAAVLMALAVGGIAWAVVLSRQVSRLRDDNAHLAELTQLDANQRSALLRMQGDLSSARTDQQRLSSTLDEQSKLIILALDPSLIPSELQGTSLAPSTKCNYVWSTNQSLGALTCRDVPSTSSQLTYQLWATRGDKTIPLASFTPRQDGSASVLVKYPSDPTGPVTDMWVTLETQASSRTRPSNEIVLQRSAPQQVQR
jgi:hypothetical protein